VFWSCARRRQRLSQPRVRIAATCTAHAARISVFVCMCVCTLQKKESAPLDKQVKKYIEGRFEVSAPKRSSRVVFTRKDAKDAKVCVCVCACLVGVVVSHCPRRGSIRHRCCWWHLGLRVVGCEPPASFLRVVPALGDDHGGRW
jgi:hypothetical protein